MNCNRDRTIGVHATLGRLTGVLILGSILVQGCASDPSEEDRSRSYFDGGALRHPEPRTIVLTGRVLLSQGRLSEAEYVLRRAMAQYPDYAPVYLELGELLIKDGRSTEAIDVLEVGAIDVPDDAMIRNNLGMAYLVQDQLDMAQRGFAAARQLDANEATYTANLAMVAALQGHYDGALALYLEVMPANEAHSNIAVLAESRGDSERAERERVAALGPADSGK